MLSLSPTAFAGGFTAGTNGTEALGRAGAFVAKADNPTAIELNVAGLAQQRGTRLLLDSNVTLHTYTFQRTGAYPDSPNNPATPWGGQPYPKVANLGGAFYAPIFALTTDFNYFDRWTFAIGAWGPPSVGNRKFGDTVNGQPAPQRYDIVEAGLLVVYPTLAAAVRALPWLDVGLALHIAVSSLDFTTIASTDFGTTLCPNAEYQRCDGKTRLQLSGVSATFSLGLLARPRPWIAIGLNLWGPTYLKSTGDITLTPPAALAGSNFAPAYGELSTQLPWILRLGVRLIWNRQGREQGDIEVDGVYEAWHDAQGGGPQVYIPQIAIYSDIHTHVEHAYMDTFAVKVGGAINAYVGPARLTFRAGFFFDSAATDYAHTRLNFDTIAKYAGTLGFGLLVRGIHLDLAYAYIYSPDRNVTDGAISPIPITPGSTQGPPVNNGYYSANRQVFSFGLQIEWERLVGAKKNRVIRYPKPNPVVASAP